MEKYLQCGRYRFPLIGKDARPLVMGILNVTPDSFSDGSENADLNFLLDRAEAMINAGVDIIDIGGESTRPGAKPVSLELELQRVMPIIYALRDCGIPLSIDTYKPEVMREAQLAGVDMINDVHGFRAEGALEAVANSDCALCIMHMQNTPQTMQDQPQYDDVITEVSDFFAERIRTMQQHRIEKNRLLLDVGFGFGKSLPHNLTLLRQQKLFSERFSLPVLAGLSRKSMLGALTGKPVELRLAASIGAAITAVAHGAQIVRVHDVAETIDALTIWNSIKNINQQGIEQ
ncbi:dihydropteroate synthase [Solimicrobium silvestre]|uniref:Dihydropteroate synthase n=1 Tax=Solimicrobium silvestre TaxID=2099400 RepID=A0A2S9GZL0_9BURK|nr:dihydropteroate synthase [Solimicrobium silvestre]PRC93147.1 DHPS: dihydropteroate synthase [Solimicrobium silvestre]